MGYGKFLGCWLIGIGCVLTAIVCYALQVSVVERPWQTHILTNQSGVTMQAQNSQDLSGMSCVGVLNFNNGVQDNLEGEWSLGLTNDHPRLSASIYFNGKVDTTGKMKAGWTFGDGTSGTTIAVWYAFSPVNLTLKEWESLATVAGCVTPFTRDSTMSGESTFNVDSGTSRVPVCGTFDSWGPYMGVFVSAGGASQWLVPKLAISVR